ncbi:MAG: hypothetical protein MK105_13420 [Crocinitomicaceae bacterium]|nr:hypothetical protein [Crocinitomicaceae bacterium]
MKNQINPITKELTFEEWNDLSFESKRDIWNHHWNPYEPKIGEKTKRAIVEKFADDLKEDFEQIGIGSFGWTVYMLFVIVKDSKVRIPKEFSDVPVNKGIILEHLDSVKAKVKFGYGGTAEIDLTEKMKIK